MCLGIPMRIESLGDTWAECADRTGMTRRVNTLLLEAHAIGNWVLVHLDNAIRVIDEAEAEQIANALEAVNTALNGGDFDHLFADLIDREPELPEALRNQAEAEKKEKVA